MQYQAIYNEQVIEKGDGEEILTSLKKLGATLDNIHIENSTIKSISPEKQTVLINGTAVKLYPFIFQAKVVPESPIIYGVQKPYWLVLGAKSEEALKGLIESLGINLNEEINQNEDKRNHQRQPIPKEVQIFVWRRDNGRCVECGNSDKLEFDHIIPISKGGSNTARNIQLLCEKCNRKKSNNIG
ncbi:MAG: HNH endonuclease [Anaerolineales bacterium]|nr:HNH endonuclease [Anaerolineales bacterium]